MDKEMVAKEQTPAVKKEDDGVYLKFRYGDSEVTGRRVLKGYELSDGTTLENPTKEKVDKFLEVFKKSIGTQHIDYVNAIVSTIAFGMTGDTQEERMNYVALMLSVLKPQNETETLLLGQFLALQESGIRCLGQANRQEGFYHIERHFLLASKLFAQANATMQTLLKYRSGGQQTVQVVHIHNEGQAIVAQNLSHSKRGEGE